MGGMMFMIALVAFLVVVNHRRRRWYRWGAPGWQHFPPQGAPPWARQHVSAPPRAELETYVDSLETRIAQLEERLDFTERLVTGSKGPVDWRTDAVARALPGNAPDRDAAPTQGEA
jgi:hypothetical protein